MPANRSHRGRLRVFTFSKRITIPLAVVVAAASMSAVAIESNSDAGQSGQAASAIPTCGEKPGPDNSGAHGTLTESTTTRYSRSGESISDTRLTGSVTVSADSFSLTNVAVDGTITVHGDHVKLDRVTARSIVVSGGQDLSVSHANLSHGTTAIQVTSDRGPVSGVHLSNNYIHDLAAPQTSHSGTHVRGASDVDIRCSNYELGSYGNAAIFLENANGGTDDVVVDRNWLVGGGYTVATEASDTRITDNVFGGGAAWGLCHAVSPAPSQSGNVLASGASVTPCAANETTSGTATTSSTTSAPSTTTARPSKTSSTTSSSTSTTATPTSSAVTSRSVTSSSTTGGSVPASGCAVKPSAATTGASGSRVAKSVTTLGSRQVLQNADVGDLVISGDGVTVRNVRVDGRILVHGDKAMIDHVTAQGLSISSASGVTVQYANISGGQGDGLNVTSDRGSLARDITVRYSYVHDPAVPDDAHYDGIQVRGVDGLRLTCSVFDAGPYQHMYNAGIYLEDANGGDANIVVAHNWVYGFGFSVMMDAVNTTLDGNRIGGDIHWGTCRLGDRTGNPGLRSINNVNDASGKALALCKG